MYNHYSCATLIVVMARVRDVPELVMLTVVIEVIEVIWFRA